MREEALEIRLELDIRGGGGARILKGSLIDKNEQVTIC
jgi:hypothetical protein